MVDYRDRRAAGSGMMRLEGSEVIDLERAKNNGYEQGKKTLTDALTIEMVLAYDGNIADLIEPSDLKAIGKRVVDEYRIDEAARSEWLAGAKSALAAAGQKKGDKKTWPFDNSANVKYPLLTTASIQFAARAYPAIVRGDEAVDVKVNGQDLDGKKAARAARVSAYTNDQLMYQCKEWEPGKDALLHQLPIIGAGFTKAYWDEALKRPRIDYASAMKVVMPADSPSMELAPRITHILDTIYPIDYERKVRERVWHKCSHTKPTEDSQKPMCFLEQCRYEDLDGDGLSEPYIVTVFQETAEVVRIDPAFDVEDVIYDQPLDLGADEETGEGYGDDSAEEGEEQPDGRRVLKINRLLPWTDYTFLPDPNGGVYGIGFGRLLEAISETVNSLINQCLDAGTWSNTVTGIAGVGIHTRGGTITLEPNVIKTIAGLTDPDKAIKLLQHPGPNPVSFQLIDMLLEAAKDITSVKDVLTGDNPNSGTPATSTLALIEQGLQVFTSIYKRIYRSMTREFETLCRLNARYLDPADYQKFLDEQPAMPTGPAAQGPGAGIGDNGGPPLTPQDMGAGAPPMVPQGPVPSGQPPMPMAGPPQAPAPGTPPGMAMQPGMALPAPPVQANPQEDFDLSDMDIRPVADPTAVTEMQRMAKAQALLQLTQNPGAPLNIVEIYKYVLQSMRLPKADAFMMERNPAVEKQAMLAEQKATGEAQAAQANAALLAANAQKAQADAVNAEQSIPLKQQELALKSRELDQKDVELNISAQQLALDQYRADIDAADREMKMIHDKVKAAEDADLQRGNLAIQAKKADNEAARMRASGASNGKSN